MRTQSESSCSEDDRSAFQPQKGHGHRKRSTSRRAASSRRPVDTGNKSAPRSPSRSRAHKVEKTPRGHAQGDSIALSLLEQDLSGQMLLAVGKKARRPSGKKRTGKRRSRAGMDGPWHPSRASKGQPSVTPRKAAAAEDAAVSSVSVSMPTQAVSHGREHASRSGRKASPAKKHRDSPQQNPQGAFAAVRGVSGSCADCTPGARTEARPHKDLPWVGGSRSESPQRRQRSTNAL